MEAPVHKIIITGTGRNGTTFLVRLFTELGLDTGYSSDSWQRDYFEHCQAGLEQELTSDKSPYIVKNPSLCETLESDISGGTIVVDHALIPVRELNAAASSRIRIGGTNGSVPGGLKGTSDPTQQLAVLAESFHRLVVTLTTYGIPHTFLLFPRFVQDADYAFSNLRCVLGDIDRSRFNAAFTRIADPALVHTFNRGQSTLPANIVPFEVQRRRKRRRRHLRRLIIWTAMAASVALNVSSRFPARQSVTESNVRAEVRVPISASRVSSNVSTKIRRTAVAGASFADRYELWSQTLYPLVPYSPAVQKRRSFYPALLATSNFSTQETQYAAPSGLLTEDAQ